MKEAGLKNLSEAAQDPIELAAITLIPSGRALFVKADY